jgi:hypothetical protein
MFCLLCASANPGEFGTEILVHFPGLKNLDKPPVWVFSKLSVCPDSGFSRFTTPDGKLAILAGAPTIERQTLEGSIVSCSGAGVQERSLSVRVRRSSLLH